MPPHASQLSFSISNPVAWAPGITTPAEWNDWHRGTRSIDSTGEPALQQMQPLLRRHAGRLGRFACSPAYDALGDKRELPVVFASRYGEVSRSVDLLSSLAANEELSPASFGLSVHNAITGLFSMARKETANTIALAAGDESAEYGMIEACGLIAQGEPEVLLVVADVPLPPVYESFADKLPDAFGWACVVSAKGGRMCTLEWRDDSDGSRVVDSMLSKPVQGALQVLPFLQGHLAECIRFSDGRRWHWRSDV